MFYLTCVDFRDLASLEECGQWLHRRSKVFLRAVICCDRFPMVPQCDSVRGRGGEGDSWLTRDANYITTLIGVNSSMIIQQMMMTFIMFFQKMFVWHCCLHACVVCVWMWRGLLDCSLSHSLSYVTPPLSLQSVVF